MAAERPGLLGTKRSRPYSCRGHVAEGWPLILSVATGPNVASVTARVVAPIFTNALLNPFEHDRTTAAANRRVARG